MTYAEEHDMNLALQETYNYVNVNTQKMIKMEEKITDEMVFFPPIKNANKI